MPDVITNQMLLQSLQQLQVQMPGAFRKAITQATGLVAYNLEAPSKKLYPVLSPMRNMLPRVTDGKGGTGVNWRAVTAIAPSSAQLPVQEGKRNASWNPSTANYQAAYKSIGLEQSVTFEADLAGMTFEDMKALAVLMNLQSTMVGEEKLILGGNSSIALGQPVAPTAVASGSGSLGNMYLSVVALTHEGFQIATITGGVGTVNTRTNADGSTTVINGGSSQISTGTSVSSSGTGLVSAYTTQIPGAVAYAWYWGATAGAAQKLGAITTLNSVKIITSAGAGTQTAADAGLAADHSQDDLAFDGLISIACGAGMQTPAPASSGAYLNFLATGTPGVGTKLTGDGAGGVNEIEAMLQSMWDNYRLSPDTLWVNSQQAKDITSLIIANGGAPILRALTQASNGAERLVVGGGYFASSYTNKFTNTQLEIKIHPFLQPGMIIATTAKLPYPVNEVNQVWQVRCRRDYYQIEWPLVTRAYQYGIYSDQFLQHYFPPAIGIIGNIGSGI